MRSIGTDKIRGGEILGEHIYDLSGRILLSRGTSLKENYVIRLNEMGIFSVNIEDVLSEGIQYEKTLCDETKNNAANLVRNEVDRFLKSKTIRVEEVDKMVSQIMTEVLNSRSGLINLKDIRINDDLLFYHSVNVCTMSVMMANRLGFKPDIVQKIGVGCLMHDFGKIIIPLEITNKKSALTESEFSEMKKHPLFGYDALNSDITSTPITKMPVLMHHERLDGSGYPHGLKGDKIHYSAKICAICDVFDAMTNDRPHRKAYSISDTVEFLFSTAGLLFEKDYVTEFLKWIPIYPEGTVVLLNTGVVAIVVKNNVQSTIRPIIRLLYNPKNKIRYDRMDVNMMQELTLKIESVIEPDMELYQNSVVEEKK